MVDQGFFPAKGVLTREGGNTIEVTTTSTTFADLITASGLTIPAASPMLVWTVIRKTTGAADRCGFTYKFNTTAQAAQDVFSTTDQAENTAVVGFFPGRIANYDKSMWTLQTNAAPAFNGRLRDSDISLPIVEITDVIGRGRTRNALITFGVDELQVYSFATS